MSATLTPDGSGYRLLVERRLDHAPEKVWRVLTERELLKQWFPSDVDGSWEVGSPLRFIFMHGEGDNLSDEELSGEVLAVEEPYLIEFRWGTHHLRYEIVPEGPGCLFKLSETFEDSSWGARNAAGWEICLENLDLLLEGAGVVRFVAAVWREKFELYKAKFEATIGPQQDAPEDHPLMDE